MNEDSSTLSYHAATAAGCCSAALSASRSTVRPGSRRALTDGRGGGVGSDSGVLAVAGRAAAGLVRPARSTARRTSSMSIPSHPASMRVYSGRRDGSLIRATNGADSCRAPTRPSAVSRLYPARVLRMANSNNGERFSTSSRTAASP